MKLLTVKRNPNCCIFCSVEPEHHQETFFDFQKLLKKSIKTNYETELKHKKYFTVDVQVPSFHSEKLR